MSRSWDANPPQLRSTGRAVPDLLWGAVAIAAGAALYLPVYFVVVSLSGLLLGLGAFYIASVLTLGVVIAGLISTLIFMWRKATWNLWVLCVLTGLTGIATYEALTSRF